MSLDFPDRGTWLARRDLRPQPPRFVHLSARLIPIEKDGRVVEYRVERPGRTYRKDKPAHLPKPKELTRLPKLVQTAVRSTLEKAKRDASWLDL